MDGIALFQQDKLVSYVEQCDVAGFIWLVGGGQDALTAVNIPEAGRADVESISQRTSIDCDTSGTVPKFTVTIRGAGRFDEVAPFRTLHITQDFIAKLSAGYCEAIRTQCLSTIDMVIREKGCDFLGLGYMVSRKDSAYWAQVESQWQEVLKNSEFDVRVDRSVKRIGQLSVY